MDDQYDNDFDEYVEDSPRIPSRNAKSLHHNGSFNSKHTSILSSHRSSKALHVSPLNQQKKPLLKKVELTVKPIKVKALDLGPPLKQKQDLRRGQAPDPISMTNVFDSSFLDTFTDNLKKEMTKKGQKNYNIQPKPLQKEIDQLHKLYSFKE